jgi:hypothetical protein
LLPGLAALLKSSPHGIEYELRRVYYGIAGTAYRPAIAALTNLVPTTQILFGSDFHFIPLTTLQTACSRSGFRQTIYSAFAATTRRRCFHPEELI